ncbi:MAG: hypothetical protein R3C03_19185 [Pirellulaceae bacterium]
MTEDVTALQNEMEQLASDRDLFNIRRDGWLDKRNELLEDSKRTRTVRDHLQSELRDLREQQVSLASDLQQLDQSNSPEVAEIDDEQLATLEAQVVALEEAIKDEKLKNQQNAPAVYSLVPYSGSGGTNRRPIYVECQSNRIVLQPFAIELEGRDFPPEIQAGNVLDAALSTIRKYWVENDLQGNEGDPYPLLVVRPDGSGAYSVARRAMNNWADEFGYELVPDDMTLDFGVADPELARRVRAAVESARLHVVQTEQNRKRLAESFRIDSQSDSGGASSNQLQIDRVNGGFKVPDALQAKMTSGEYTSSGRPTSDANNLGSSSENQTKLHTESNNDSVDSTSDQDFGGSSGNQQFGSTENGTGQSALASTVSCIAKQRGANWALPTSPNQRVAYVRPIRFYCSDQALVFATQDDNQSQRLIISLVDPNLAVEQLVTALNQRHSSWGPPPENGYWKPVMKIQVLPGGQVQVDQLQVMLEHSGIEIEVDE